MRLAEIWSLFGDAELSLNPFEVRLGSPDLPVFLPITAIAIETHTQ